MRHFPTAHERNISCSCFLATSRCQTNLDNLRLLAFKRSYSTLSLIASLFMMSEDVHPPESAFNLLPVEDKKKEKALR